MKLMSVMLVLAGLLLLIGGVAGIWRPAFLRLDRRRHAAALAGFAFVLMAFGVDLDPPPGNEGPAGPVILALWISGCLFGWGILQLTRFVREERRVPVDKPMIVVHPEVDAFRNFAANKKAETRKLPASHQTVQRSMWYEGDAGTTASFVYVDRDGVVTDRVIANWYSRGPYIHGFCLDQAANRTFRKDRINDWRGY